MKMRKMKAVGGWRCHHIKVAHVNRAKRFIIDQGVDAVQRMYGLDIPESVELALNDMGYVVVAGVIWPAEEYESWLYEDIVEEEG